LESDNACTIYIWGIKHAANTTDGGWWCVFVGGRGVFGSRGGGKIKVYSLGGQTNKLFGPARGQTLCAHYFEYI